MRSKGKATAMATVAVALFAVVAGHFSTSLNAQSAAASPAEAKQACQALKVAGEKCFVAQ